MGKRILRHRGAGAHGVLHSTACVLRSSIGQSEDRRGLCRGEYPDREGAVAESRCQARTSARCRFAQVATSRAGRTGRRGSYLEWTKTTYCEQMVAAASANNANSASRAFVYPIRIPTVISRDPSAHEDYHST